MAKKIILDLDIDSGDSVRNMQQLETELEQLREEIKGVEIGSAAFDKLAGKIQTASSEVKTLDKQMEGLEPQQKAEAFLKMGEGVAGGFAMAQGAMALVGVESEDLEKLQVKVQSAISIAVGARMVSEALLNVAIARRVIQEKLVSLATSKNIIVQKAAIVVQKALNFVMSKNPIAIVIKLLGLIGVAFVKFRNSSEQTKVKVSNAFAKMANAVVKATNKIIDGLNMINPFKAIKSLEEFPIQVVPALEEVEDAVDDVDSSVEDLGNTAKNTKKELQEVVKLMQRGEGEPLFKIRTADEIQDEIDADRKRANDKIAIEQEIMDRKIQIATDTFNTLANLASVFEGGNEKRAKAAFKLTKTLNLAQAIMDTFGAANKILNDPNPAMTGPQRFIAMAAAISTGLANVAQISRTKFEGGASAGGGGGGLQTIAAATPAGIAATGGTSSADIASAISGQNQTPIKAFVVAQEVTDMQQINEELQIQSSL